MSEHKIDYYLKSIDRRWKQEVHQATEKVIVLSPYITSNTAAIILNNLDIANNSEIYTVFSVKNFVSGSSSIKTIRLLHQRGFKLYHLPRLHAKMLIVPGKFASIGSQNFTNNGVKNKEASIIICDPVEVQRIISLTDKWLIKRQEISSHMINRVERNLLALRRKICPIWRESNELENQIWQDETQRIEREKIKAEREKSIKIKQEKQRNKKQNDTIMLPQNMQWRQLVNEAKNRIIEIAEFDRIDRSVAEHFIANSVYWYDHVCGRPVEAPGHKYNIYGDEKNWKIDFGANTFLVSKAIVKCQKELIFYLDRLNTGQYTNLADLRKLLELCLRSAVANHGGCEYNSLYPLVQDKHRNKYMKFGSQAIKTDYFINEILRKVKLGNINSFFVSNTKIQTFTTY